MHEANGHLDLLVINKSATNVLTGQFQIAGFQPASTAQVWQYGEAQDTAQSQTTDGHSALSNFHGQPDSEWVELQSRFPCILDDCHRSR